MSTTHLNRLYLFLSSFALILVGSIILKINTSLLSIFTLLMMLALLIDSLSHFSQFLLKRKLDLKILKDSLIKIILGLSFYFFSTMSYQFLFTVFGCYTLLKGFAKLVSYRTYYKNQLVGRFTLLVSGLFLSITGILLIFSPFLSLEQILIAFGVYFILSGCGNLYLLLMSYLPNSTIDHLKRKIKITPPIFLEAFVPKRVLTETNKILKPSEVVSEKAVFSERKSDIMPDLEIYIHVTEKSFGSIGHMDLCFEGEIISYGNYDEDSYHLFDTMGDGVLLTTDKASYIPFCIKHSQKTLFGFGIQLTPQEKQDVANAIKDIKAQCYEWKSNYSLALSQDPLVDRTNYQDYASLACYQANSKLYKFNRGPFKSYFVLTTNCCLLSDSIIGPSGIDLLSMNGILTPGTYLNFLRHEFKKPNSAVISYDIYN
ncbi:HdeD family acid-resistance protein [Carnobacterium divergens]|uniref:HdeD family acid-resistance protein n=1 Tax=Carnobacterium divergens TaxID=2748 RepID=UPI00128D0C25|nr:DUF308 domain-containing protein [Carnobacterium divergens]MPQ22223.1 DUF308 domain-containing protein [Carnobacterium divergens]